jgi:hypothetical protein
MGGSPSAPTISFAGIRAASSNTMERSGYSSGHGFSLPFRLFGFRFWFFAGAHFNLLARGTQKPAVLDLQLGPPRTITPHAAQAAHLGVRFNLHGIPTLEARTMDGLYGGDY